MIINMMHVEIAENYNTQWIQADIFQEYVWKKNNNKTFHII